VVTAKLYLALISWSWTSVAVPLGRRAAPRRLSRHNSRPTAVARKNLAMGRTGLRMGAVMRIREVRPMARGRLGIAVACLWLVASSAWARRNEPIRVWTERDKFQPELLVINATAIQIKGVQFTNPWFAILQPKYLYNEPAKLGVYVFDIMYYGSGWMFWDTLRIQLSPQDVRVLKPLVQPSRDTASGGSVEEHIRFEVPREVMEQIAAMPSVDMRVDGKFYYDFFLNSIGTGELKMLADKVRELVPADVRERSQGVAAVAGSGSSRDYADELRKLAKLRDDGIITEQDFQLKKQQLLGLPQAGSAVPSPSPEPSNPAAAAPTPNGV